MPEWRTRKGRDYPLPCLLAIMVMATLAGVVRGQRDLAAFAGKLTQPQLRTLGSYRKRNDRRDSPKETTFQRMLAKLDAPAFERILIEWQLQRAGQSADDQIAIDGKAQRDTTPLRGKNKGKTSEERIVYLCSLEPDPARGGELLERIRRYWDIEGGLHQRLDVSADEDSSRVRQRNAILVLGILRRCAMGIYRDWRSTRKNLRQSTFKDFHDAMNGFNNRLAFATITSPRP